MPQVRWPRVPSPAFLAALLRRQKHPRSAVEIFLSAVHLFPSSRPNRHVIASLSSLLLSSPSFHSLLPPLLLSTCRPPIGPSSPSPNSPPVKDTCPSPIGHSPSSRSSPVQDTWRSAIGQSPSPIGHSPSPDSPPDQDMWRSAIGRSDFANSPLVEDTCRSSIGRSDFPDSPSGQDTWQSAIGQPAGSEFDFSSLPSPPLTDSLFAEVISALPLRFSLPLFLSLPNTNCINWTESFNCIISKLLFHNKPKMAIDVFLCFSSRPEVEIEAKTLDLFVSSLLQIGRPDLGLELYKEYHQLCLVPSHEINCGLVKSLVDHNFLDEAMHFLYHVMKNYDVESSVVMCRTVIEALCVNGREEEGIRVLKRVLCKVRRKTGRVRSFLRIPIEFEGKSLKEIRKTVDFVLSFSGARSVRAYETIANDLYKERRFKGADKVFDEMTEKGFRVSVCMYEAKIEALCKEGKVNEAVRVLEHEMREKDCAPSFTIFNLIIRGFCENGESLKAVEYLSKMNRWPKCGAKRETYEILIKGLCGEKWYGEAVMVLDRMVKQSHRPTDEMFGNVIEGLCEAGNRYEAVLWLEEMVAHGLVPSWGLWGSLVRLVC